MSASNRTILIVEDFLPDQELYRRCLAADPNCAYRFLEAETVKEALGLCRGQDVDAILLDYALPGANGLAFLEALDIQYNGSSPPVVMVTGQGDERVAARAFKLGAEDYVVKRHLTPELLQLTVRSAIENARLRLQLQQSHDRFRVSIENMLDCFGIYSAIRSEAGQIVDFRIDYLNAAALQNNRMTVADIGRGLCEMLPAHYETGLFAAYCQVVETGEPLIKEELVYADVFGMQLLTRAFDIHASKLNDGLVISWRDVTARKQAELEHQQQLERERIVHRITQQIRRSLDLNEVLNTTVTEVREYLNADRAFVYRFNPDFSGVIMVESISEGQQSVMGAEVADTCFMKTHGEDYRQGRIQAVEDIYTAGLTDCHVEMLSRFQIRANLVVPILQKQAQTENLWGLLVLSQCSSSRRWQSAEIDLLRQLAAQMGIAIAQAELHQQVQESQRFAQQISDAAPGFFYLYDLIHQRNVYSNGRITDILGYTPEEIKAMGEAVLLQLLHPDDFAQVPAQIAKFQTAEVGQIFELEYRLRHANGEWRWFSAREVVYSRTPAGAPHQVLGIAQEITDRKSAEVERERLLAEAEAANHSKDEFVTLVAHELRSPLNAVLGWAKLLQFRQLDAATTARALETIARNTQAQAQLVEDLLDVSRMVRGTLQLTMACVDLAEVIQEAIETVRPTAETKGLRLEAQLAPVHPISADPSRLRQVMLNLLTNAIKFTPVGGQVWVRLAPSQSQICIQVSDTGKGIHPEFLPHVFERFRQDQQDATTKQGLGLGLALVKHLVESHGGTIRVESQGEGLGATFTVLLPCEQLSDRPH